MDTSNKKVIVGLSGGIDSAVSTLLLKEAGYDVTAVFMRNWDSALNNDTLGNPNDIFDVCPQEKDYMDAKAVADYLGVELKRIDFVNEYWDHVFKFFISEYQAGRTPNPDILCNSEIKFKCFLEYALTLGADYIAMGHYAQVTHSPEISRLYKGHDTNKDQTYFLSRLSQAQISKALFPVGHLDKSVVKEMAKEAGLPCVVGKKESTGICFIGERRFREFLKNYLPAHPGEIVDTEGHVLGEHEGVWYHTIGERHGLQLGGEGEPWYVLQKDVAHNRLIVGRGHNQELLFSNRAYITNISEVVEPLKEGERLACKLRYRSSDLTCIIESMDNHNNQKNAWIKYPETFRAAAPGQACVFYRGDEMVGGGTIDVTYMDETKRN